MMNEDFKNIIGHDDFVWWIGVVEDREDNLFLGRCKIRIFGTHTPDLSKLPTKDLPWAMPISGFGMRGSFAPPYPGDYVVGFFTDGLAKQSPVYFGVFPAIPQNVPEQANNAPQLGFSATAKQYSTTEKDKATTVDVGVRAITYTDTPAMKPVRVGAPTTPAVAYTTKGTGIEKSDNNRAHVCDIANNIRFQNAINELKNWEVFKTVRTAIEAVTTANSPSPLAQQVTSAIKVLRRYARMIKEILDFINEVILEIASYIAWIRTMISWILSLPAQLLALLRDCLAELTSAITGALGFESTGADDESLIGQLSGLYRDVTNATQSAINVQGNAQSTANSAKNVLDPKSYGTA
jgi:hypothetical protein